MNDRSLDEFLGSDDAGDADEDADDAIETDEGTATRRSDADEDGDDAANDEREDDDDDSVEPATSTYVRDPAGGACAACGETVERRWQSDAGLVCPDCKEW